MSEAVVELINYQEGDELDPKDPIYFHRDLSHDMKFPFVRVGSDFLKRGANDNSIVIRVYNCLKILLYLPFN